MDTATKSTFERLKEAHKDTYKEGWHDGYLYGLRQALRKLNALDDTDSIAQYLQSEIDKRQ